LERWTFIRRRNGTAATASSPSRWAKEPPHGQTLRTAALLAAAVAIAAGLGHAAGKATR
jgi:hypothetical protein